MALAAIDRDWSRRLGIGRAPETTLPQPGIGTFPLPDEIDWFLWRLISSERLKSPRDELELDERWTYPEMLRAHAMLDSIEDAVAKENAEHERRASQAGRR